jgi:hypothetical protein
MILNKLIVKLASFPPEYAIIFLDKPNPLLYVDILNALTNLLVISSVFRRQNCGNVEHEFVSHLQHERTRSSYQCRHFRYNSYSFDSSMLTNKFKSPLP